MFVYQIQPHVWNGAFFQIGHYCKKISIIIEMKVEIHIKLICQNQGKHFSKVWCNYPPKTIKHVCTMLRIIGN